MLLTYLFLFISVLAILCSLFVLIYHNKKFNQLKQAHQQLQTQQDNIEDSLIAKFNQVEQLVAAIASVTQQIELIQQNTQEAELVNDVEKIKQQLSELSKQLQASPQDKLYTRAIKMAELGADIEEICQQCEISRLEAETLLAIRRQKPQKTGAFKQ